MLKLIRNDLRSGILSNSASEGTYEKHTLGKFVTSVLQKKKEIANGTSKPERRSGKRLVAGTAGQ